MTTAKVACKTSKEAILASLSYRMRSELERLHKNPEAYVGSCTNTTMKALKKRGLTDIEWTDIPGSIYRKEKWVVTPAGAALFTPLKQGAPA